MIKSVIFRLGLQWLVLLSVISGARYSFATETGRVVTRVADGVYVIRHPDDVMGTGNSTVIVGDREVFVVDSEFFPAMAREDIAQIRQWTDKPVGYVLNTHFHNDHNNGNRAYMDAFPGLAIIAQVETKKDMDLIQPGNIERARVDFNNFAQGKHGDGRPFSAEEKKELAPSAPELEQAAKDFKELTYQPPTLTFIDEIDIDIGNREVRVKHLGRGNTPGDAIVYLPKEKIIVAGDLLVHPVPYAFDGYPSEWVTTLQKMAQLDAQTIIPGHGPVMHDKSYLYLVTDLMKSAVEQVREGIRKAGHPGFYSVEKIKSGIDLSPFKPKFAGDDKDIGAQFDTMAEHLVNLSFKEAAIR